MRYRLRFQRHFNTQEYLAALYKNLYVQFRLLVYRCGSTSRACATENAELGIAYIHVLYHVDFYGPPAR